MKIGIIGVGAVGAATAMSVALRGKVREILLIDKDPRRAKGVAADMQYGLPLRSSTMVRAASYEDIADVALVIVAAGINERDGGATDRTDPSGRLRLLEKNVRVFEDIVPRVVAAAPGAVIMIATNPPEPLVEITRQLAKHDLVVSTSTCLDTLRFKFHLSRSLGVNPNGVDATVIGEHGTSCVFLWSSARVAGIPIADFLASRDVPNDAFRMQVEEEVRYANVAIVEGIGASQFGIGIVASRVAEAILGDEKIVIPVGSHNRRYGVTLSLPSVVGSPGVRESFVPEMSEMELASLEKTASKLRDVTKSYLI
jgi:L-lactate dehydrogenase